MADDTTLNLGTGGNKVADDELDTVNGVAQTAPKPHSQRIKLGTGGDGVFNEVGHGTYRLPVASPTLDFVVNSRDGSGNILTYTENGVARTIARDVDGLIVSDTAD